MTDPDDDNDDLPLVEAVTGYMARLDDGTNHYEFELSDWLSLFDHDVIASALHPLADALKALATAYGEPTKENEPGLPAVLLKLAAATDAPA